MLFTVPAAVVVVLGERDEAEELGETDELVAAVVVTLAALPPS